MGARRADMVYTQCGIAKVTRRVGILTMLPAIIVVCEKGHGRSVRGGQVIVSRLLDRDDINFIRRGTVEHAANGLIVG